MVAAIRARSVNVSFDTVRLLTPDSTKATESPQALPAVQGAFMSEFLDCDPNKGFVAFPVALFDLDLTPGAFRTLAELCRMANTDGQCWPSLAQLGRRLGRSRAAVSGYITELRAADVLRTEEQKMANGYNYRLRYTVTFWKEWRASMAKSRQKTERTVQQVERPLETKNHIHKNQPVRGKSIQTDLIAGWKAAVGKATYPEFSQWPSRTLVAQSETASLTPDTHPAPIISTDIASALRKFAENHGLRGDSTPDIAAALVPMITSKPALEALIAALEGEWQPHWRNPPNLFQLTRLCKKLPPIVDAATEQKLLKSYLRRWKLYERRLPSSQLASKVAA